jgi:hypothetical protein
MSAKLKIHTSPSAFPNPQRLHLFIHEKDIADQFDEIVYDMAPVREQRKWPHLKMTPWGNTDSVTGRRRLFIRNGGDRTLSRPALPRTQDHGRITA